MFICCLVWEFGAEFFLVLLTSVGICLVMNYKDSVLECLFGLNIWCGGNFVEKI